MQSGLSMDKEVLIPHNNQENTCDSQIKYFINSSFTDKSPIIITENAIKKIKELIDKKKDSVIGIRIMVAQKGCFGFKYNIEYAYDIKMLDVQIQVKYQNQNFIILIDPKAMMFINGTEMDHVENKISSGFVFKNPNEKGRCGCGESFYV
ncbi:iron-sulfur cluster assembly accessory protein [Ehrlichia ruminantium]|uniref:Core domain-containing protein n=1 Tax=Ehrlichia ruminantium (strain Welgevonden) TaxID=254945 RepID=A0A0H3LZA0_EHRRW|nr:iron-sulfur cluster assembly accessory protein [Ehrlichia ruminantium]KYW99944.1 Fe-S cluster assembly protein HesB [Ehrlichia ruminantium]QLK50496.1 iron-sulfur cluster assembly accessory protein [Ehrlichia ruminantium]QLK51421.1 iron-sulfur cluster assembly accessory protein [Ehrlichia ruminantium]QLK52343.1 iron-sulfur cluster assembly accessory protein [Ehrlichia ruminantium]QLK53255.1 iron-sulfur cluster assembly accessory protein [Ehrlichia ruminantium]